MIRLNHDIAPARRRQGSLQRSRVGTQPRTQARRAVGRAVTRRAVTKCRTGRSPVDGQDGRDSVVLAFRVRKAWTATFYRSNCDNLSHMVRKLQTLEVRPQGTYAPKASGAGAYDPDA